jgi:hypothetical protein
MKPLLSKGFEEVDQVAMEPARVVLVPVDAEQEGNDLGRPRPVKI